jgi:hypothetical protein
MKKKKLKKKKSNLARKGSEREVFGARFGVHTGCSSGAPTGNVIGTGT